MLAATALVFVSATAADAQESTTSVPAAPPLPVGLSLVSQDTWVPLRGSFTMKLHIDDPALAARPNAAISIQIHSSTTSRSGFDAAIANQNLGGTLYLLQQIRLSALLPDEHDMARWIAVANTARADWKRAGTPIAERRPLLLRALDRLYHRPADGLSDHPEPGVAS